MVNTKNTIAHKKVHWFNLTVRCCLVSYFGHSLMWKAYPSAEKQSVYSTAPAYWADVSLEENKLYIYIYIYIYIIYIYIYIYIYIFTNLISTSIHGTRKKPSGTRDNSISNHRPGEKKRKIYRSKRKKRPTSSDPLKKKIKGYAVSG